MPNLINIIDDAIRDLTEDDSPNLAADFVVVSRASDSTPQKVRLQNLGGPKAEDPQIVTAALADTAEEVGTVTIGKVFIITKVIADVDCRIRLYQTAAHLAADAARAFSDRDIFLEGTDHGVICDLLLTSGTSLEWNCSPDISGSNGDDPESSDIHYAVQNLSGGTTAITVDFQATILRY